MILPDRDASCASSSSPSSSRFLQSIDGDMLLETLHNPWPCALAEVGSWILFCFTVSFFRGCMIRMGCADETRGRSLSRVNIFNARWIGQLMSLWIMCTWDWFPFLVLLMYAREDEDCVIER